MDPLVDELDIKLRKWDPEVADQVRRQISEIISLADQGVLDLARGRAREQEVLDILDKPGTR